MMTKRTQIAFFLVLVLLAAAGASAQGGDQPTKLPWHAQAKVQEALSLTSEQVAAITTIEEAIAEPLKTASNAKRAAFRNMQLLLNAGGTISQAEMDKAIDAFSVAAADEIRVQTDRWMKLRAILDDTQWEKLPKHAPRVLMISVSFPMQKRASVTSQAARPAAQKAP